MFPDTPNVPCQRRTVLFKVTAAAENAVREYRIQHPDVEAKDIHVDLPPPPPVQPANMWHQAPPPLPGLVMPQPALQHNILFMHHNAGGVPPPHIPQPLAPVRLAQIRPARAPVGRRRVRAAPAPVPAPNPPQAPARAPVANRPVRAARAPVPVVPAMAAPPAQRRGRR